MIADIFAIIDNEPVLLRQPMLPHAPTAWRVPLFAIYQPRAAGWPSEPWYHERDMTISVLLIGGRRFSAMPRTAEGEWPRVPGDGMFTLHREGSASFIVLGFELESLRMYERVETIATSESAYSKYGTKEPDGSPNPPMVLTTPVIKGRADALRFARFTFETMKVRFVKSEQSIYLFGGGMWLFMRAKDGNTGRSSDHSLGRFIIDRIEHDDRTATLDAIDFRHLLNVKYPTETFTRDEYPFLEERHIDTVRPRMMGIGNGVPGVCLNGLQIYAAFPIRLERYDFQFPPGWTELYRIDVRMSENTWVEIWPGLGNPHILEGAGAYRPAHPAETAPAIDAETGIVQIWWSQALQGGRFGNNPNNARIFAKWPHASMEGAIRELLGIASPDFLLPGFGGEFGGLADMGLFMDSAEPIFTWIEKLQASNIIGGQLIHLNDALRFRLENPNRARTLTLAQTDVLNHEDISVVLADEFMYSGWEIAYRKSHADTGEDGEGRLIGTNRRYPTAGIYNGEDATAAFARNPDDPRDQFFDTRHLARRVRILRDLVQTFRHKIAGLTLPLDFRFMGLLVYDVIGYLPKTLEEAGMPMPDWLIYEKKVDPGAETITLTLIERVRTANWHHEPFLVRFDQNHGDAESVPPNPQFAYVEYPDLTARLPEPPARRGFLFVGWNLRGDGLGKWLTESTPVVEHVTAFAIWRNKFVAKLIERAGLRKTVRQGTINEVIRLDASKIAAAPLQVTFDQNNADAGAAGPQPRRLYLDGPGRMGLLPLPPARPGFAFAGWNTEADASGRRFDERFEVTRDITAYAMWRPLFVAQMIRDAGPDKTVRANIGSDEIIHPSDTDGG